MMGYVDSRELVIGGDGTGTLTTEFTQSEFDRTQTRVYEVSAESVERVRELVDGSELYRATARPEADSLASDSGGWTITLDYGEKSFTFNDTQQLSEGEREAVDALLLEFDGMASGEPVSESLSPRKLILTFGGVTYTFLVDDTQAATDLLELCPMDLETRVYGAELDFVLPEALDVSDAPEVTAGEKGELLYRSDTRELVIKLDGFEAGSTLYGIGEITQTYYLDDLPEDREICHVHTYGSDR